MIPVETKEVNKRSKQNALWQMLDSLKTFLLLIKIKYNQICCNIYRHNKVEIPKIKAHH